MILLIKNMWKTKQYLLTNLWYRLFWKPKMGIIYRGKSSTRYSHGNAGYLLGTVTEVVFIDEKGKEHECTYKINKNNKVSIKIGKKIMSFDKNQFKFYKSVKRSYYWGQGGGNIRTFRYLVVKKTPKNY